MSSGGGNPVDDFKKKFQDDPLGTIANVAVNVGSGGMLGYDEGRIGMGVATHAGDEALGEITGRNLQREQMGREEANIAAAERQRLTDLKNQQEYNRLKDVNASTGVQAIRNSALAAQGGLRFGRDLGDETDFLGL